MTTKSRVPYRTGVCFCWLSILFSTGTMHARDCYSNDSIHLLLQTYCPLSNPFSFTVCSMANTIYRDIYLFEQKKESMMKLFFDRFFYASVLNGHLLLEWQNIAQSISLTT